MCFLKALSLFCYPHFLIFPTTSLQPKLFSTLVRIKFKIAVVLIIPLPERRLSPTCTANIFMPHNVIVPKYRKGSHDPSHQQATSLGLSLDLSLNNHIKQSLMALAVETFPQHCLFFLFYLN